MIYNQSNSKTEMHGTTILALRKGNDVVIAADGQVSLGHSIIKSSAKKLRVLASGSIIAGFAGSTADAFTLFERLEAKLEKHSQQLMRSCVELAKDWRTDKYLRRLEAMLLVADENHILMVTGNGDVMEPEHNVAAIGSGGFFALAAARALLDNSPGLSAEEVAKEAMNIAADICVYSNHNILIEHIKRKS